MFSRVSVCHSVHRVVGTAYASWDRSQGRVALPLPPLPPLDIRPGDLPPTTDIWWISLETCSNLFTWGPTPPPPPPQPVLTSGDGHQNTYGWQAGGTHPTGVVSCSKYFSSSLRQWGGQYYFHLASKMSLNSNETPLTLRVYSHRIWAATLVLTLAWALERNTLISIAPFTLSVSISINTSIKNQIGSGPIQKRQH